MKRTDPVRRASWFGGIVAAAVFAWAAPAKAAVPLTRVSADPFTNTTSQHATEVEPDTFAYGSTVVAAYQVGRTFNAGAFADPSSPYERVSDPSVAYDARHNTWMISSIPLLPNLVVPTIFVSLSTDGGATFGAPVRIPPPARKVNL